MTARRSPPTTAPPVVEGRHRRLARLVSVRPRPCRLGAIDAAARRARERRPAGASEEWLSRLPALIDDLCEDWGLSLDDERVDPGAVGVVLLCHTESGRESVLKLCPDRERLRGETSAMLAWTDGPATAVLAHRPGALLLQRARPGAPSRLGPSQLVPLLNALHRPAIPGWGGLRDWRASTEAAFARVPSLQALGRELLKEGQGRPVRTLHGDLQPANILSHRDAHVVIDPIGIVGPRELDVAVAALNHNWGETSSARITRLARLTGTDPAFALRFGQLSAIYSALAHRQ
jgi:streptomycin 6-kinase